MRKQEMTETAERPVQQKKGLLRLFELMDRDMSKFFKAGALTFVSLLPYMAVMAAAIGGGMPLLLVMCIPAGMLAAPQFCGMADTVMRSMRDEIGWWWWDTYKKTWLRNAKATLLPGGIFGFVVGLQMYSLYAIALMSDPTTEFWLLFAGALVTVALTGYYLPMLVCMDLPFSELVRNCFVLLFSHPVKSLLAALVQLVFYGLILVWFPLTSLVLLAGIWLPMLAAYQILYPALDRHFGLKEAYEKLQKEKWGNV